MESPHISLPSKRELLKLNVDRVVKRLYKLMLDMQDQIVDDHDEAMTKLIGSLPAEYKQNVMLADYLPEYRVERNRKKILDEGNEAARELKELIDNLRVD